MNELPAYRPAEDELRFQRELEQCDKILRRLHTEDSPRRAEAIAAMTRARGVAEERLRAHREGSAQRER